MKYLLLFTTMLFTAEMEVDGNLKVTGTVDANGNPITNVGAALSMTDAINGNVLQSALRDDGVYEYKIIVLKLQTSGSGNTVNINQESRWIELNQISEGSYFNSIDSFSDEVNSLFNDGWDLKSISGDYFSWWVFKRPITEE